jgi:hypothetical protein
MDFAPRKKATTAPGNRLFRAVGMSTPTKPLFLLYGAPDFSAIHSCHFRTLLGFDLAAAAPILRICAKEYQSQIRAPNGTTWAQFLLKKTILPLAGLVFLPYADL